MVSEREYDSREEKVSRQRDAAARGNIKNTKKGDGSKAFQCDCGRSYASLHSLRSHYRLKHSSSAIRSATRSCNRQIAPEPQTNPYVLQHPWSVPTPPTLSDLNSTCFHWPHSTCGLPLPLEDQLEAGFGTPFHLLPFHQSEFHHPQFYQPNNHPIWFADRPSLSFHSLPGQQSPYSRPVLSPNSVPVPLVDHKPQCRRSISLPMTQTRPGLNSTQLVPAQEAPENMLTNVLGARNFSDPFSHSALSFDAGSPRPSTSPHMFESQLSLPFMDAASSDLWDPSILELTDEFGGVHDF